MLSKYITYASFETSNYIKIFYGEKNIKMNDV